MTTTQSTDYRPALGDLVTIADDVRGVNIAPGTIFKIESVPAGSRGVNYTAKPLNGGRGLRAAAGCFVKFDGDPDATTAPIVLGIPYVPTPDAGVVVRIAGRGWKEPTDALWVVLAESRKGGIKVTRLGGNGGRYYPHVPMSLVTVVPLDALAEALVDAL